MGLAGLGALGAVMEFVVDALMGTLFQELFVGSAQLGAKLAGRSLDATMIVVLGILILEQCVCQHLNSLFSY